MSKKHRVTIKLEPGETFVVGPVSEFDHIAFVYRQLAEQAETDEDRERWIASAEWIEVSSHTGAYVDYEEDEKWN